MTLRTDELVDSATAKALGARAQQAYAQESRRVREDDWIVDHLPLVRHIVRKVVGHLSGPTDFEDLVAAGTLSLVKAARAYDSSKHTEFKTYAYIRIRGGVIDELRGQSHRSPSVHRLMKAIRAKHQAFQGEFGRPPTDEELAERVGMSIDKLFRTLEDARRQHFLSIHGLNDDSPSLGALLPAAETTSPEGEAEHKELLRALTQSLQELPKRDRQLLLLYYERDLTMREVAEVLGITESRVSQLHASALFKLSMRMGGS